MSLSATQIYLSINNQFLLGNYFKVLDIFYKNQNHDLQEFKDIIHANVAIALMLKSDLDYTFKSDIVSLSKAIVPFFKNIS